MDIQEFTAEQLENGRLLFTQSCEFVIGAAALAQVPETDFPEIAFAGRSNVGKSSLINALTGHKALARTSNKPGRTQQVNFFNLGQRMMIADLPGYGYAKAPRNDVDKWTALVNSYLKGRAQLRRTCLLIDARHGIKDNDREIMGMLDEAAVAYQIVLTKADKIKEKQRQVLVDKTSAELVKHTAAHPMVILTSSEKGDGIAELRAILTTLALTR